MLGPFQKPDRNVINETEKKIFLTDFFLWLSWCSPCQIQKEKKCSPALSRYVRLILKNEEIWDQWIAKGATVIIRTEE